MFPFAFTAVPVLYSGLYRHCCVSAFSICNLIFCTRSAVFCEMAVVCHHDDHSLIGCAVFSRRCCTNCVFGGALATVFLLDTSRPPRSWASSGRLKCDRGSLRSSLEWSTMSSAAARNLAPPPPTFPSGDQPGLLPLWVGIHCIRFCFPTITDYSYRR